MSVRFIVGRAGSGKSQACLDDIREKLQQQSDGSPLILLVPEQATYQAEYELVSTPGLSGIIRAQVISFQRLAWRVMQEVGGTTRVHIDDSGKKMLLHRILQENRDKLGLFRKSADQMGFMDSLNQLFNEFRRYCITPEQLAGSADRMELGKYEEKQLINQKLSDVSLIYRLFDQQINQHYVDSEDILTVLNEQISQSTYIRNAEIWMDGFHGFTPQEYAVIGQLMQWAKSVTITLNLDREYFSGERPHELNMFYPTAKTMIYLQEMIDQLQVEKDASLILNESIRFHQSPMLQHLEKSLETREPIPPNSAFNENSNNGIFIVPAANRRAEVEGISREIIRLVREEGYRWRDFAVTVRDLSAYSDLIMTVFKDYDIPFFIDQKRSVMHHPLVEFIRSALEVVDHHWRYEAVFRCVKTDFLLPLSVGDTEKEASLIEKDWMNKLENVVLSLGISGSKWLDKRPWEYKRFSSLDNPDTESSVEEKAWNEKINRSRDRIVQPLSRFQKQIEKASHVKEQVEALFQLLEEVKAPERLEQWSAEAVESGYPEKAKEHAMIWNRLLDMLDQVVEMMGEEQIDIALFSSVIDTGLESIRLGLVPPAMDQVLIGNMERTRPGSVKHGFILGVIDGVFPAKPTEDGVISENEREFLHEWGLEIAPDARRKLLDEQFLIYSTLTIPSHSLWLSYPLADEEGRTLIPSEIIQRLKKMFPLSFDKTWMLEPPVGMEHAGNEYTTLEYMVHPRRTLSYLAVQLRQWMRNKEEISPSWWEAYNWFTAQKEWQTNLSIMMQSIFYTNKESMLSMDTTKLLYGEKLRASVSRMELFSSCAFHHFASYGLGLREREIYRLEAPDIGQLFHAALSQIAEHFNQGAADWASLSQEDCFDLASNVVESLAPRLQSEILLSSSRYFYIARKLKNIVGRATTILGEHARRSSFKPIGLELGFGPNQPLPPITVPLRNNFMMEIIGRIDRVDRAESDRGILLRIIDYKSGQTSLNLPEVYYGLSLQMLTYLDAVVTHAEQWIGKKAIPAGVLYFHVHNPILAESGKISVEKAESALMRRFKMKGFVLEDAETVEMMDAQLKEQKGHSTLIPAALKADGQFYKNSSVLSLDRWDILTKHVRNVVHDIGSEITAGRVEIKPYKMSNKVACTFCSFKSVCQFDPLISGNDYRILPPLGKEEVWSKIKQKQASDIIVDIDAGGEIR